MFLAHRLTMHQSQSAPAKHRQRRQSRVPIRSGMKLSSCEDFSLNFRRSILTLVLPLITVTHKSLQSSSRYSAPARKNQRSQRRPLSVSRRVFSLGFKASVCIRCLFSGDVSHPSEHTSDLQSPTSPSKLQGGTVTISCIVCPRSNEAAALGQNLTSSGSQVIHRPPAHPISNVAVVKPEQDQSLLENFVHSAAESSNISTPPVIATAGTMVDMVSTTTSSDSFTTVMGFLERFVQIGDAIAEVSISPFIAAKLFFHSDSDLLAGPPICKTCVECADSRTKGLYSRLEVITAMNL
jgi:hypothetical protein